MKQFFLYIIILVGLAQTLQADNVTDAGCIRMAGHNVTRTDSLILVDITFDLSSLKLRSNRSILCTPLLHRGDSLVKLPPFVVNGRDRQILYQRLSANEQAALPAYRRMNGEEQTVDYHACIARRPWMDRSEVSLVADSCGCGWDRLAEQRLPLFPVRIAEPVVLTPAVAYAAPQVETVKARALQGKAYLDFPVNRTEIHPDYRNNPRELAAIRATIDSVRHNPYASITEVNIKGYASPEGSYANNTRLAKGRAEALAAYIRQLYDFGEARMRVDYEPEDWEGLERAVAESSLTDKEALLAIIRDASVTDPDRRDNLLKGVAGGEPYRYLLREVYPALRHSDYSVGYTIRPFTVEEAKELIYKDPSQLSLEEMYRVAQTYEPGSAEYNEVFEIAVRIYPGDPVSNLNAAFTAIRTGRADVARRYMARAEKGPHLDLAQAVLDLMEERYDEAETQFDALSNCGDAGIEAAVKENLRQLRAKREEMAD